MINAKDMEEVNFFYLLTSELMSLILYLVIHGH
jgi:hypothetical protein